MATWWIDTDNGAGDGTDQATPAPDWATINASVGAGDTVYVKGVLREHVTVTATGVTVDQWPDGEPWTTSGATPIDPSSWSLESSAGAFDVYATPNGSFPTSPVGLVYDYRLGVAEGVPDLYVGFLPEDAGGTLLASEPGWQYDAANQRILASFPNNDDPRVSGKVAEYCRAMTTHAFIVSGNDCTVRHFKIHLWWDNAASNYWAFIFSSATGGLCEHAESSDVYYHAFGSTGSVSSNNVCRHLTCRSIRRGCDSQIVHFVGTGETMVGDLFEDVTVHLAGSRRYDGVPLETGVPIIGLTAHANGTIGANGGLVFRRITTVRYADEESAGGTKSVTHPGGNAAPVDATDPATFPIIHYDCEYQDYGAINLSDASSHGAFVRCRLNTDGTVTGGAGSNAAVNIAAGCSCMMESCTVDGEMAVTTNHVLFRVAGALFLSNCSVRAAGSTDGIFFGTATADIDAVHCVFARGIAGSFCKGGTMPQPVFTKCWYDVNLGDAAFAIPAAFNTQAEWQSLIDPNGSYDVDFSAQFASVLTLRPAVGSAIEDTKDPTGNPDAPEGINRVAYQGNAGAWQMLDPFVVSAAPLGTGIGIAI